MPYGNGDGGDGTWERTAQLILMLSQLRGGATESQIHTQEPVSLRLRFGLPALNALSVVGAFVGAFAGLYLMAWGVAYLLDVAWIRESWLVFWALLVVGVWLLAVAAKWVFKKQSNRAVGIAQAFAAVGVVLVLGLVVGSLLLTVKERFGLELASMVVGAGLVLGCVGWGYNQASELMRGYWRQSPFETAIINEFLPLFAQMLGMREESAEPQVRTEDPRIFQRQERYGVVARPVVLNGAPVDEQEALVDEQLVQIDAEAGNLIWFVRFAARRPSLSIRDLTLRPAPLLPFPEDGRDKRLRRGMIRRLLVRGSTEDEAVVDGEAERGLGDGGFWTLRGQGATPEWVIPPDQAKRKAQEMWDRVYDGELPVPDYWDELNETRRAA